MSHGRATHLICLKEIPNMQQSIPRRRRVLSVSMLLATLLLLAGMSGGGLTVKAETANTPQQQARTPTQTVAEFYKALRARRFREAFALSIYKPAIEGLSAEEFADLQPDFENMAAAAPEKIEFGGEQISGDDATVFARVGGENSDMTALPLIRIGGAWIFGDRIDQELVVRDGKEFFPKARITVHHKQVESVLFDMVKAQLVYSVQNGGQFADLPTLLKTNPGLAEDTSSANPLGYKFQLTLGKDGKSYKINAEPVRYGRTGLLSYYMDQTGLEKKDTGGKPYNPPGKR
jgi:hypothetical protein